ncbi:MAG: hypothetical protein WDZ49_00955 [Litorilinea sp.]
MSDNAPNAPETPAQSGTASSGSTNSGTTSVDSAPDPKSAIKRRFAAQNLPRMSRRVPTWAWLIIGLIVISSAFASGLWSAPASTPDTAQRNGEPQVAFIPTTPTAVAILTSALLPTATADTTSEATPRAQIVALATPTTNLSADPALTDTNSAPVTDTVSESAILTRAGQPLTLPTVTPTPVPPPIAPRSITVGGQANLRMLIANSEFQSGGRPLQIPVEARTYGLDADTQNVADHWCIQMGLVNLDIALDLTLNPANTAIIATGAVELYNDFCTNRGNLIDSTEINLTIPADARVQSTHNLFGERQLLNLSGLLDMDTAVILELQLANLRPAQP